MAKMRMWRACGLLGQLEGLGASLLPVLRGGALALKSWSMEGAHCLPTQPPCGPFKAKTDPTPPHPTPAGSILLSSDPTRAGIPQFTFWRRNRLYI